MPSFIGIDLSWRSEKHSGGAVLHGDQDGLVVREFSNCLKTLEDIKAFVGRNTYANTVIAIDAPLIIKNKVGQRPCETEIGRRFGAADASAHSSNLTLYPNAHSIHLAKDLEGQGFLHCPEKHTRHMPGKWFFEVYPHPAHVVLFRRTKIIKYKKPPVASRRRGLSEFRQNIKIHLSTSDPPLIINSALSAFLEEPLEELRGTALKQYEDVLDATFCAYLAAYFWAWSYSRNEMIGDLESGYIINPLPKLKADR